MRNYALLIVELADVLHDNQVEAGEVRHLELEKTMNSGNQCWDLGSGAHLFNQADEDVELLFVNGLHNVLVVVSEEEQATTCAS